MSSGGSAYAFVPARGGSKGIPGKNVRTVDGVPLVVRAVTTARAAGSVDRVVVSTDDDTIAELACGAGAEVIRRPPALAAAEDYRKMIALMDKTGLGLICNMDGGFGKAFDRNMTVGGPFRDRIIHFARLNWEGINEPGWPQRTAAELERCFRAGAHGLKIAKELGLQIKNTDGTYIQADDRRLDPIWEMCARYNKPVMIHISDSYGRFLPIGPENERYEAGLWRSTPAENYYRTGHPAPDVIEKARENMHAKHPNTRFVNAHMAMLYYDMDKVAALLDKYPNADVELSATVQDLGRAPLMIRKFFLKYQDRILFGSDGNPGRGIEEFWVPH
jgi:hypothetical protein